MDRDFLNDTLSQISDKYILEANVPKKKALLPWLSVAACLIMVISLGILLSGSPADSPTAGFPATQPLIQGNPTLSATEPLMQGNPTLSATEPPMQEDPTLPITEPSVQDPPTSPVTEPEPSLPPATTPSVQTGKVTLLADPSLPVLSAFPTDQSNFSQWQQAHKKWQADRTALHSAPEGYADTLTEFWKKSIPLYLSDANGTNTAYSPISLYMALSMLAQTAGGQSQQEILDLLGASSMEYLAQQAQTIFKNHYENDGVHTAIMANSLWMNDSYSFRPDAAAKLADIFYASVYQGALESPEMNDALRDWLNAQTGGLLQDSIGGLRDMDALTAMVIASTIHYRCKWLHEFIPEQNTRDIFQAVSGKKTVTFMNTTLGNSAYYAGNGFCAVSLPLDDGSKMWLILPDEGISPEELLAGGKALDFLFNKDLAEKRQLDINLSLPKFDIVSDLQLTDGLKAMGIQALYDPLLADFSGIAEGNQGMCLGGATQGVRVTIDEVGLTGVAYTVIEVPGVDMPPPDVQEIDFVLDRPFLFFVESSDGLPLFTGIVNEP